MRLYVNKYLLLPLVLLLCALPFGMCSCGTGCAVSADAEMADEGRSVMLLSDTEGQTEGADELVEEFRDILPPGMEGYAELSESGDSLGFEALFETVGSAITGSSGEVASFFLLLLGCAILMACAGFITGEHAALCRGGVATICAVAIFSRLLPLIKEVTASLSLIHRFFGALIPLMGSATLMGGGVSASSAQTMGMSLTLQCYSALASVLGVLFGAMFALGMASSIGEGGIGRVAGVIRSAFSRGMGVLTALLAGTLALQTMLAGVADTASMRAARYAVTGLIPIVGNAVSGSLAALAGGLSYARGVIGGGGIAVLVSLFALPLITLLLYKLCFFLATVLLEFCGAEEGVRCISAISGGFDALISVYSMTAVIYIFEVIVFIMGGVAIS